MKHRALALVSVSLLAAAPALGQGSMARYRVYFDATWSSATHPSAYPSNAHFSPLIGGTHALGTHFWEEGQIASSGIEVMAESGFPFTLRAEIEDEIDAGNAFSVVTGPAIDSPDSTHSVFRIREDYPLVTVVTMIAPSPDWFLGVDGVNLYEGGRWVDSLTVDLYAYDAGSDNGLDFDSNDSNTVPKVPIALIQSGPLGGSAPLGTFTFVRESSTWVYGCGTNPEGTMVVSGMPRLTRTTRFTLDDPLGVLQGPALTSLSISTRADAAFPCGTIQPGFGLGGASAGSELLIEGMVRRINGPLYQGSAVTIPLTIPDRPGLVGRTFYVQGTLMDTAGNTGLTEAVQLFVGL